MQKSCSFESLIIGGYVEDEFDFSFESDFDNIQYRGSPYNFLTLALSAIGTAI